MQRNIIYEDGDIIIVFKPSGIATQTARVGQLDMVSELKNYLAKEPGAKGKGGPYLGIVHRLDQPVSGLLAFAKNHRAAGELGRQAANGQMRKFYYALAYGKPVKAQEKLEDYLYRDAKTNRSLVVESNFPGAKKAVLNYRLVRTLTAFDEDVMPENDVREVSLMEIELLTGRHHQIRVQMSHAGLPLLGDSKYGSDASKELSRKAGCRNVALCAYKLMFRHPVSRERVVFEKQPEGELFFPFFSNGI